MESEKKKPMALIGKITIGFVLGIVLGLVAGPYASSSQFVSGYMIPALDIIGQIFLSLLKMLIVPLVLSSIIMGAASIGNPKVLGRIGIKTGLQSIRGYVRCSWHRLLA